MKNVRNWSAYKAILFFALMLIMQNCTAFGNMPMNVEKSTLGEATHYTKQIKSLPLPKEKIVVGVYKFRDQTGQYKAVENGASWSTAIPQGTTAILIKALEDSRWFKPIERENLANLLNERQLIRTTRKEYMPNQINESGNLPPLLYAGILLEGGVISYDTNVLTGGLGARYFGIGASTQYRQDRITVYLRAVSTQTGEVIKSVYTSKNILSTSISGGMFRYVDVERLLETEIGITQNEPVQLAVKEAIEKAIYSLIVEGARDEIWGDKIVDKKTLASEIDRYELEQTNNDARVYGKIPSETIRSKFSLYALGESTMIRGDYVNANMMIGAKAGMKYALSDQLRVDGNASYHIFENEDIFRRRAISLDLNLEFLPLSKNKFSPYLYGGAGLTGYGDKRYFKAQFGGGFEYLFSKNFAIRLGSQYDYGFDDQWDFVTQGNLKDASLRFNAGLSYYIDQSFFKSKKN